MRNDDFKEFNYYPDLDELHGWISSIWELAEETAYTAEIIENNGFSFSLGVNHVGNEFSYVKFTPEGMDPFYAYWQPVLSGSAPLLVHLPGYGAEMSTHPELVARGFNVLHVSPLGYATPDGPDEGKKRNQAWPVLPDTVLSGARGGYRIWLANCLMAVAWAMQQAEVIGNRVSFFGTSQGGGAALLLGSLFKDKGVRCVAADVPFLTHYPLAAGRGAYAHATEGLDAMDDKHAGWKALGFVDTITHAARLTCPVLLTAGGKDEICPPETIRALYDNLPGTKSLSNFEALSHRYTREFIPLAAAWFRIYA